MSFGPVQKIETEKRRFAVLKHLDDTPGYRVNAMILAMGAVAQGVPTTSDQMAAAISWLEEQELVTSERFGELIVAQLTPGGQEVARGARVFPGVMRPGPGA